MDLREYNSLVFEYKFKPVERIGLNQYSTMDKNQYSTLDKKIDHENTYIFYPDFCFKGFRAV